MRARGVSIRLNARALEDAIKFKSAYFDIHSRLRVCAEQYARVRACAYVYSFEKEFNVALTHAIGRLWKP